MQYNLKRKFILTVCDVISMLRCIINTQTVALWAKDSRAVHSKEKLYDGLKLKLILLLYY